MLTGSPHNPHRADPRTACQHFLKSIGDDIDLPALGSAISRVVQLTSADNDSIHKLSSFVLSDVALTQKVLRLSNTAFYRTASGAAPVTTISRAILLLGFETVRLSALAMLLVDRLPDSRHAQSVRAELAQSLYASVIGRELARRTYFQGAEEAGIAALFKNLGRLLVAAHDHDLYSRIMTLVDAGTHTPNQASVLVMGCSFDLIAETVLHEWQIPEPIIRALAALPGKLFKPPKNRQEWMQLAAAFSCESSPLIPALAERPDSVNLTQLIDRYGQALNLDRERLTSLFADALEEIRGIADTMELAGLPSGEPEPNPLKELQDEVLLQHALPEVPVQPKCYPSGKPMQAKELLLDGLQQVTTLQAAKHAKGTEVLHLILQVLYQSMGFRFAALCLREPRGTQFLARIALGEQASARQTIFRFPADGSSDLFQLSMQNNADLMIADATSPKIQSLLPSWHKKSMADVKSFIVLPLVFEKNSMGFFYADRALPAPEGVSPEETAFIKILKGQALAAMRPSKE